MRSLKSFSSRSSTGGWGFDVEECEEQNSRNTAIQSGPARRRKGRLARQNGRLSSEATRMRKARNAMKPPTGAHRLGWRAPEASREAKPPLAASSSVRPRTVRQAAESVSNVVRVSADAPRRVAETAQEAVQSAELRARWLAERQSCREPARAASRPEQPFFSARYPCPRAD